MVISRDGTTRRAVLDLLKRRGPTEATQLAAALGVTHAGVRRHLDALVSDGLVTSSPERRPVGRPVALYRLTPEGDETFPRAYPALTDSLLEAVCEELGDDGVDRVFARRAEQLAERVRPQLVGRDLAGAVAALAAAQDEAGYLAESSLLDDGTALLVEHNCAIARIAGRWPQACSAELATFASALGDGVTIERVHHMASGDHTCTYLVRRTAQDAARGS